MVLRWRQRCAAATTGCLVALFFAGPRARRGVCSWMSRPRDYLPMVPTTTLSPNVPVVLDVKDLPRQWRKLAPSITLFPTRMIASTFMFDPYMTMLWKKSVG